MEENIFYMSIGYPLGLCEIYENKEWKRVFNVELNGEFVGLSLNDYNVWKYCFFDIKSAKSIRDAFDFPVINSIEELINNKLLIKLDIKDIENTFDKLKILTPIKNGFGVGLNKDDKFEVLNQGKPFLLNSDQFRLWAECDNRKTNREIFDKLSDKKNDDKRNKIYFINIIFTLKTLDLIRLNRREKVK